MIETLSDMTPALIVLFITGAGTLLLGWWLGVKAEGKDYWVIGEEPVSKYPYKIVCPKCGMTHGHASHDGLWEIRCHSRCGFEGTVEATSRLSVVAEGRDEWLTGDDDA